jgi:hypothetical protein
VTLGARAAPDDHELLVDGAGGWMWPVGEGGSLNVSTYWTEPKATCRPHRNPAKMRTI